MDVGFALHAQSSGNDGIRRRYTMKPDVRLDEVQNEFVFLLHVFKRLIPLIPLIPHVATVATTGLFARV